MSSVNLEHLFPQPDKFRIAVCLSGQPRHWKTAMSNIKRFFEFPESAIHPVYDIPIVTDYFIHTWDVNTWRYPKKGHEHFYTESHDDKDEIKIAYNPKDMLLEAWDKNKFARNWDSMFYSHARSLMLKRKYELANNFQYDMVIKSRLDTVYNPQCKISLDQLAPKVCYSTYISLMAAEFNYNNFDDVVFFGDSPTMDLVGDLYHAFKIQHSDKEIKKNSKNIDTDITLHYGPGCLLSKHMANLGIHAEMRRTFDYAVVRSTAVDENLDGIIDYDEIRKKWFEWYI